MGRVDSVLYSKNHKFSVHNHKKIEKKTAAYLLNGEAANIENYFCSISFVCQLELCNTQTASATVCPLMTSDRLLKSKWNDDRATTNILRSQDDVWNCGVEEIWEM